MKHFFIIIILFYAFFLASCIKKKYSIKGTLINEVTGNGKNMGGEKIQLLRIKANATFNIFSNPDKSTIEAEAITDEEGRFDFGTNKLKPGDYRIDYVQGEGKTFYGVSKAFKDISLDESSDIDEKIRIIPTMGGINFVAYPISTASIYDTILVRFSSEMRLKQDPFSYHHGASTGNEITFDPHHSFGGAGNSEFMGRLFIRITKSYSGLRIVKLDTVFVEKDQIYKYTIPF